MRVLRRTSSLSLAALALTASLALAQDPAAALDPPAHIAAVDGTATIDREDQSEAAVASMPVVAGDRLRTERGRVELLFPDGTSLAVDEFSSVELQAPTLLRITSGRIFLRVTGAATPSNAVHFQLDTPTASATTEGPGEYRIAISGGPAGSQTELAVLRGSGTLMTERGAVALRAGERSVAAEAGTPSSPLAFNSARFDAFDRWAGAGREARLGSGTSNQYLPPDLRMYGGTFDRGGSWGYEAAYGNVWYPSVAHDWRPYYNGYWSPVPRYGWTWIGVDPWTWPTHHYGRWGQVRNRWFWIPDRRWATAWVSWGTAPGYVSWSPLGFDNRPVFGLWAGGSLPGPGWVVVPQAGFGRGRFVNRYAVSPRALPVTTRFAAQNPPLPLGRAVPRGGSVPGFAVPRDRAVSRQPGFGPRGDVISGPAGTAGDRRRQPSAARGGAPVATPPPYAVPRPGRSDPIQSPRSRQVPVTRAPGVPPAPASPGTTPGARQDDPVYQVPPVRNPYQRRAPASGTTAPSGVARPRVASPAEAPVRAPNAAPPAAAPAQPGAAAAPAAPAPASRAVPRRGPSAGPASPAAPAPAPGDRANRRSPGAASRSGEGSSPPPAGPPAGARQRSPESRRR